MLRKLKTSLLIKLKKCIKLAKLQDEIFLRFESTFIRLLYSTVPVLPLSLIWNTYSNSLNETRRDLYWWYKNCQIQSKPIRWDYVIGHSHLRSWNAEGWNHWGSVRGIWIRVETLKLLYIHGFSTCIYRSLRLIPHKDWQDKLKLKIKQPNQARSNVIYEYFSLTCKKFEENWIKINFGGFRLS